MYVCLMSEAPFENVEQKQKGKKGRQCVLQAVELNACCISV